MNKVGIWLPILIIGFGVGSQVGIIIGESGIASKMRDKVIIHCIEKTELCKEEYDYLKDKIHIKEYKRPQI